LEGRDHILRRCQAVPKQPTANRCARAPDPTKAVDAFGFKSTNGVVGHLKAIEAKGRLKRLGFMPRGLAVIDNMRMRFGGLVS